MANSRSPFNGINGIIGLVVGLVVLYVLINLIGWVIWLLYKVGIIFFIASLVIDSSVFTGFGNSIKTLFKRNWVTGLVAALASVALYPFTGLYLLGTALFRKKLKEKVAEADARKNGQWADFEEIPREPTDIDVDYEELPPLPPPPEPLRRTDSKDSKDSKYDDLFE
ncbi:MAG: putative membrane protein [Neolewinella sp.]|jgi:predicted membrane protein